MSGRINLDSMSDGFKSYLQGLGCMNNSFIFLEDVYNSLEEKSWDKAFEVAISKIANSYPISSSDEEKHKLVGGTIILPAYKIKLYKTIKIPACAVEIKGTFMKSTLDFWDCVDEYGIYVDGLAHDDNDDVIRSYGWLKLEGVVLNGRKKRDGFNPITAIYFKGHELHNANINDCAIRDCKFFHWDTCIGGVLSWDMQFDNCRFHDGVLACDFQYQFQMNSFNDCKFSSFEEGFRFNNIDIQEFRTCDIVNINKLIGGMYQSHVIFEGCYLEHLPDFGNMGATNEAFASSIIFKNSKILGSHTKITLALLNNVRNTLIIDDCYLPQGLELTYSDSWSPLTANSRMVNIWNDDTTDNYYKTKTIYKFEYDNRLSSEENIANYKNNFPGNNSGSYYTVTDNSKDHCVNVCMDRWEGIHIRNLKCGGLYTFKYKARSNTWLAANTFVNTVMLMDKMDDEFTERKVVFRAGLPNKYEDHYRLFESSTDISENKLTVVSDDVEVVDGQINLSVVNSKKKTKTTEDFVIGDEVIFVDADIISISLFTSLDEQIFEVEYMELIEGLDF